MINEETLGESRNWVEIQLHEIGEVVTGNTPPTKHSENYGSDIPFIKPPHLQNNIINKSDTYLSKIGLTSARLLPENSILVSCIGNLGKTALNNVPVATNQQINSIVPSQYLNSKFIFYQVQSSKFINQLEANASATTIPIVNKSKFEKLNISLCSLNEQNRIVDKIETLFSEVDAGIANLTLAKRQLEQYRQSLLQHAFEGKLTAEWRKNYAKHTGKSLPTADELLEQIQMARQAHYDQQIKEWEKSVEAWEKEGKNGRKPSKPKQITNIANVDKTELNDILPDCWSEHFLESLSTISGGLTKNSSRKTLEEQVPYLRVANVYANELRLDDITYIGIKESEKPRVLLQKGDLLIVEGNGSIEHIGRVALWNGEIDPCYHQNHLIKARTLNNVDPHYILYFLMSPIGRKRIVKVASSTTGLHTLSLSKVSNLIIPFTSLDEQKEIVKQLEEKLSDTDRLIIDIDNQLIKANLLKTSILHKAFQGKLVPQDPNDPPASELLAQIKAEREAQALAEQQAKDAKKKNKATSKRTPKKKAKVKTKATDAQGKSAKIDTDDATTEQGQIKLPL
ncbi:hypothetical protein DLE54_05065 [Psychrobacter sp. YP14]|uniref:restriction endonuclease subunit S n=1 Tax=Psychrobacter sp. YP14 TaxID=2203895 RepID=UPI000D7E9B3C|nr:restriction endonuclease subunit S [Psychrobacter sp. YP14]AWT48963.1 hypothetical protein DLE54_05065 [Psychrobacter sp. YP14]